MSEPPIVTDSLTTFEQVESRLEEESITPQMRKMIEAFILDASDQARHYGASNWNSINCPPVVGRIVASAVARHMNNPAGYAQSRAADETLSWQDRDNPGELKLSEDEIERIQAIASPSEAKGSSWGTVQLSTGINYPSAASMYVPVAGGIARPYPFLTIDMDPPLPPGYWR